MFMCLQMTHPQEIEVVVPMGCGPGSLLDITSPHTGRKLTVHVPDHLSSGARMNVVEEVPIVPSAR